MITKYQIWKTELGIQSEASSSLVEEFVSRDPMNDYLMFKNAANRLFALQNQKQGDWIGDFTFRTDFFVYRLYKSFESKVNYIKASSCEVNKERYNSLTSQTI